MSKSKSANNSSQRAYRRLIRGYFYKCTSEAWSVNKVKCRPTRYGRHTCSPCTNARNSRSDAEYPASASLNRCDRYSTGCHAASCCYSNVAPVAKSLASTVTRVGSVESNSFSTGALVSAAFNVVNAVA